MNTSKVIIRWKNQSCIKIHFLEIVKHKNSTSKINIFYHFLAIFITDADAVKQITIQKKWKKSKVMNEAMKILLGSGLVVIEDDLWKKHRNLIMPSFSQQNLKNMVNTINIETKKLLDNLEKTNENLIFPNFISTISELTLSVILVVGFGTNTDMTSELEQDFTELYHGFYPIAVGMAIFGEYAYSLPFPHNFRFSKIKSTIQYKITKIIESRKIEKPNPDGFRDLLSLLIDASDEEGNNFTTQELIDESMVNT